MEIIASKGDDFAITCHRPTLSLTGCAIGWIEYSLCTLFSLVTSESLSYICSLAVALTLSRTGFVVGANEYSLCIFRQLAYFCLKIHKYAHLPSSDAFPDWLCRWFDRVVYLQPQTVSLLPFNNPQINSLAIARQCF